MRRVAATFLSILVIIGQARAQEDPVLDIRPDREDCLYDLGDTVKYEIALKNVKKAGNRIVHYRLSEDGVRTLSSGEIHLEKQHAEIRGSLDRAGFLRCDLTWIDGGDTLKAVSSCGVAVEDIQPTGQLPEDFERFWRQARAELVRIPIDPRLEEVEVEDIPGARRFRISLASTGGGRVQGWLTFPPGEGPFPAVLAVPGAGVGRTAASPAFTRRGMAVLSINVHGIEPDGEEEYYRTIKQGPMGGYDYLHYGKKDPYQFYFRRVIQDCMRSLDYLHTHSEIDSSRIGMMGSSQGGFLALITASIDKRVKALVANVPALCDNAGSLYDRASGGPQLLEDVPEDERKEVARAWPITTPPWPRNSSRFPLFWE